MRKTILLLSLIAFFTSCDNIKQDNSAPSKQIDSSINVEVDRITFSTALAKALQNEEFRELIKSEALKKFDGDYDIFYQKLKDVRLSSGLTVESLIGSYLEKDADIMKLTRNLPLLTIFIPELSRHSASKWDTKNEIPIVGVRNYGDLAVNKPMKTFDSNGNEGSLSYRQDFLRPIIIVKDNERLVDERSKTSRLSSVNTEAHEPYLVNDLGQFAFWDNTFDKRIPEKEKYARINDLTDGFYDTELLPDIREAFENGSSCQRDNVYYRILPQLGRNSGVYRPNFAEALTSIRFSDKSMFNYVMDDATDGNFEFQVTIAMTGAAPGAINSLNKGISCSRNDVFSLTVDPDGYFIVNDTKLHLFEPIPIVGWNIKTYGDTWKFVVQELDPGTTTTVSSSVSSTFGTNFTNNDTKTGIGFGTSTQQVFNSGFNYVTTGASDALFDGTAEYCQPLVTSMSTYPMPPFGFPVNLYSHGPQITTGYVTLNMRTAQLW